MKKSAKLSRLSPRPVPGGMWYYANGRSISLVVPEGIGRIVTLCEPILQRMLKDFRPKRKRRGSK